MFYYIIELFENRQKPLAQNVKKQKHVMKLLKKIKQGGTFY